MSDHDCTACGQDLRLPPIDPKDWRALVLIASIERRKHGPNFCKRGCRVCRAFKRLGDLSRFDVEPNAPMGKRSRTQTRDRQPATVPGTSPGDARDPNGRDR